MEPILLQSALASGSLPEYSGDQTTDTTFQNFIQDYRLACESFGMTDVMAARAIGRCLTGHAQQFYKELVKERPVL